MIVNGNYYVVSEAFLFKYKPFLLEQNGFQTLMSQSPEAECNCCHKYRMNEVDDFATGSLNFNTNQQVVWYPAGTVCYATSMLFENVWPLFIKYTYHEWACWFPMLDFSLRSFCDGFSNTMDDAQMQFTSG